VISESLESLDGAVRLWDIDRYSRGYCQVDRAANAVFLLESR
jgi:hypothetical protein